MPPKASTSSASTFTPNTIRPPQDKYDSPSCQRPPPGVFSAIAKPWIEVLKAVRRSYSLVIHRPWDSDISATLELPTEEIVQGCHRQWTGVGWWFFKSNYDRRNEPSPRDPDSVPSDLPLLDFNNGSSSGGYIVNTTTGEYNGISIEAEYTPARQGDPSDPQGKLKATLHGMGYSSDENEKTVKGKRYGLQGRVRNHCSPDNREHSKSSRAFYDMIDEGGADIIGVHQATITDPGTEEDPKCTTLERGFTKLNEHFRIAMARLHTRQSFVTVINSVAQKIGSDFRLPRPFKGLNFYPQRDIGLESMNAKDSDGSTTIETYLTVGGEITIAGKSQNRLYFDFGKNNTLYNMNIHLPIDFNACVETKCRVFVTFDGNEVNRLFDKYKAVNPNLIELSRTPVLPAGEGCPVWVVLVSATDQREWILATLSKEADPDANEEERWINFHAYLFQKFRTIAIRLAEENIRTDKMIADSQEEA